MNKPGFTLVEVLLASAIAAIMTGLLFMVVRQLNSSVPVIDRRADVYEKAAILNAQLERDLSGVTAPHEFYARQKTAKDKPEQPASAEQKKTDDQKKSEEEKKAKETQETTTEQTPKKPLEKIFYSTNKEGMLDQLSFVTTNPLQIYWGEKSGSAKPRIARVMYSLQEEKNPRNNAKKSYRLVRQESPLLDWDQFKADQSIKEYTLADNIKSLMVEYSAVVVPEEKAGKPTQAEGTKVPAKKEIEKKKDWTGKTQEQNEGSKKLPLAPGLAQFEIALWDQKQQRSIPFSFAVSIPAQLEEKRSEGPALLEKLKTLVGQTTPTTQQPQQPTWAQQQRPAPNFNFSQPRL